jgi:hypothetical protein
MTRVDTARRDGIRRSTVWPGLRLCEAPAWPHALPGLPKTPAPATPPSTTGSSATAFVLAFVLLLCLPVLGSAGPMKSELKVLQPNGKSLRTLFEAYGFQTARSLHPYQNGVRFWIPSGVADAAQTGIYSYFALAGDCEVILTYEILNLQPPQGGYGSGVGLAFDVEGGDGRAMIQRVDKGKEGSGYLLSSGLMGRDKKLEEEYKLVEAKAPWGRMGIRRIKKELIFLATLTPGGDPEEIGRMPFTDRTIRPVRLFADPGGSPTAIDVRITQLDVRAEELTGGAAVIGPKSYSRWWWLAAPLAGMMGYGLWRWRTTDNDKRVSVPGRR